MQRLLIVDGQQLFTEGFKYLLRNSDPEENWEIIAAHSAAEAANRISSCPGISLIIIADLLPDSSVEDFVNQHHLRSLAIPFVLLTQFNDWHATPRAISMGAAGQLSKAMKPEELVVAIRSIMEKSTYFPPLGSKAQKADSQQLEAATQVDIKLKLTPKQINVLSLLAEGLSNKQISQRMNITEHTVKSHLSSLFKVFKAKNRTETVLAAQGFLATLDIGCESEGLP